MTLQNGNFISSGISRNPFMSSMLCINICNKWHISIIVRSGMACNWRMTSCRVVLASCNLRLGQSAMQFSCSLSYWIALRSTSPVSTGSPPRFRLDSLETFLLSLSRAIRVPITSSVDMFSPWLYVVWNFISWHRQQKIHRNLLAHSSQQWQRSLHASHCTIFAKDIGKFVIVGKRSMQKAFRGQMTLSSTKNIVSIIVAYTTITNDINNIIPWPSRQTHPSP